MPRKTPARIVALSEDLRGDRIELEELPGPVFIVEPVVGSPGEIRARRVDAYRLPPKPLKSKNEETQTDDT